MLSSAGRLRTRRLVEEARPRAISRPILGSSWPVRGSSTSLPCRFLPLPPEVSPETARAVLGGIADDLPARHCPVCWGPLRDRQRTCSGRCRAAISRQRRAEVEAERDQELQELLERALKLLQVKGTRSSDAACGYFLPPPGGGTEESPTSTSASSEARLSGPSWRRPSRGLSRAGRAGEMGTSPPDRRSIKKALDSPP